jgi:hypothetical protein
VEEGAPETGDVEEGPRARRRRASATAPQPQQARRKPDDVRHGDDIHFVYARWREDDSGQDLVHRKAVVSKKFEDAQGKVLVDLVWHPVKSDNVTGKELPVLGVPFLADGSQQGTWHFPHALDEDEQ